MFCVGKAVGWKVHMCTVKGSCSCRPGRGKAWQGSKLTILYCSKVSYEQSLWLKILCVQQYITLFSWSNFLPLRSVGFTTTKKFNHNQNMSLLYFYYCICYNHKLKTEWFIQCAKNSLSVCKQKKKFCSKLQKWISFVLLSNFSNVNMYWYKSEFTNLYNNLIKRNE